MNVIFKDTFTDSAKNLEAHIPDIGASWTELWATTPGAGYWNISGNTIQGNDSSSSGAIYTANATYGMDDYYIQVTMVTLDISADQGFYLLVRIQDQENMYGVRIQDQNGTGTCQMYKKFAGTWSTLGSAFDPPEDGSLVKLEIIGSSLKCYTNNILVASATDTSLLYGKAGLAIGGGTELVTSTDDSVTSTVLDNLIIAGLSSMKMNVLRPAPFKPGLAR